MLSYVILFLDTASPGQIFRYLQRNNQNNLFSCQLLLSDPAGRSSLRCLSIGRQGNESPSALDLIQPLGPALSLVFPPQVTLLWRQAAALSEPTTWGYTIWGNGVVLETVEHRFPAEPKLSFLSRLPGMKRRAALSPDIAWALARGLPIDRVPAAGLRRNIPITDYDTVAQLDQRSLLVENSPRLYRFTL